MESQKDEKIFTNAMIADRSVSPPACLSARVRTNTAARQSTNVIKQEVQKSIKPSFLSIPKLAGRGQDGKKNYAKKYGLIDEGIKVKK